MSFRKFQADQIFDGSRFHGHDKVLVTDKNGKIENIIYEKDAGEGIEKFSGILTPGFINCHCHLELSHLKDVIPPHTGLIDFLCSVVTKRGFDPAIIQQEIVKAEKELYDNGTVAVGDIGNTSDTAIVKSKSNIRWQNFVEVIGFTDEKAEENIKHYSGIAKEFGSQPQTSNLAQHPADKHQTSLVPHAPYSISPKTFKLINEHTDGQVISMHNQEHTAEDELYKTGGGDYLRLFRIFGIESSPFPITGTSSIRSVLPYFNNGQTLFLVHNTYMPPEDIRWSNEYAISHNIELVYCFCVNANLYIENRLPVVEDFIKAGCHIVLGTDSYSSNWQLSIASEIKTIHERFPSIKLERILQWATINGARALKWGDQLGSFERGKQPGIVTLDIEKGTSRRLL